MEPLLRRVNQLLIAFDLALGLAAAAAPDATLRAIGHRRPSPDARALFRRCAPIWLTFAAAHANAARRGRPADWWALAWLRGTEIATDWVWARSPAIGLRGRMALRFAGLFNLAAAGGFALLGRPRSGAQPRA